MNTIRKKYRALRSFMYSTKVTVNGKTLMVSFNGGSRQTKTNGFFVTDNADIQRALEALPSFNTDFYLESTFQYEKAARPEVPPTQNITVPAPPMDEAEDADATEDDFKDDPAADNEEETPRAEENPDFVKRGITNAGEARLALVTQFPEEKPAIIALKRADDVRQYAKEKGITFPDWE
ncbi:MAG: hypothetical protein NC324_08625 [Bacteroides sp.]|nr:hypothetical protein [Bacteroides sp.]